jgi:hypothetical protein
MNGILHDVTHTFTHMEMGFLYTLKELAIHPGKMQRRYLAGDRVKHQKPFSMFFISATFTSLAFYWIAHRSVLTHEDEARNYFFKNYFVFLQVFLLPFCIYRLVTFLEQEILLFRDIDDAGLYNIFPVTTTRSDKLDQCYSATFFSDKLCRSNCTVSVLHMDQLKFF